MDNEFIQFIDRVKELYKKYGIKSMTMDDVARHLGISKKTIYQFVKNKDELVKYAVEREAQKRYEELHYLTTLDQDAIHELLGVNEHMGRMLKDYNPATEYDLQKYYPELFCKMMEMKREKMYNAIIQNIEKGKKDGHYRMEVNSLIIAKLLVLRFDKLIESDIFTREDIVLPNFFNELFEYHIRGIATPEGLRILDEYLKSIKNNTKDDN